MLTLSDFYIFIKNPQTFSSFYVTGMLLEGTNQAAPVVQLC